MKTLSFAFAALFVFSTIDLFADTLVGRPTENRLTGQFNFTVYMHGARNGGSYTDGQYVTDLDTGIDSRVFCMDYTTYTSSAMNNSNVGQLYHTMSLADADSAFYSDLQKERLQSLFDHVYTKAYNDDYTPNDPLYSSIFQLAVWEIVHETSGKLDITSGSFGMWSLQEWNEEAGRWEAHNNTYWDSDKQEWIATGYQTQASKDYWATYYVLRDWFDAVTNNKWDAYGYEEDHVDLTVYVADGGRNVSQTLIGVKHETTNGNTAITPEPATMLVMGLGLTGLAAARRFRRK
ncbi:MAG: PEP-CTERM sorting domain-containing protein [Planctomycetaceae bacterium]|nr:PEP-CTERM sorting domain-containing protein [Planctomycetaceae bacterium]